MLTFEIICGNCGKAIYSGMELRYARDILRPAEGRCTSCGSRLSQTNFSIEVIKTRP